MRTHGKVVVSNVHLRDEPGGKKVGILNKDDTFDVLDQVTHQLTWLKVRILSGPIETVGHEYWLARADRNGDLVSVIEDPDIPLPPYKPIDGTPDNRWLWWVAGIGGGLGL